MFKNKFCNQLLAQDTGADGGNINTENKDDASTDKNTDTKEKDNTEKQEKTFTQEELDKIIERRLTRALKKAEDDKAEAEKLAKMSEAERQQALFEKEKAKFEEERKSYQKEKMELEVIKQMSSKNLPTAFAKYLLADNAETALENIKTFETEWQKAIEKAVDEKLKGSTPKAGGSTNTITKEQFKTMGYKERVELMTSNPDLYKELNK